MIMSATATLRTSFNKLFDEIGTVDQVGIEERVAKFQTRSIKKSSKLWGLKTAVSMVDLTTLEGKDTPGKGRVALPKGSATQLRSGCASGCRRLHLPLSGKTRRALAG